MQLFDYFNRLIPQKRLLLLFTCLFTAHVIYAQTASINGKVINKKGIPLSGISIVVKGTNNGTVTNDEGVFKLTNVGDKATLRVSSIGYEAQEIKLDGKNGLTITLHPKTNELDETIIRAYGTTTRRLNTGSIGKVTTEEIERQPVSNPLAALEGRVPGLVVTQSSGVPGSAFKVQIRGQNSIAQGSEPLFVIDGVPFAPGNNSINELSSAVGTSGLSPFNLISPSDIQSIEVLKDADATAIYGSRGANGVILITTKKGKPGTTRFNISAYTGNSKITRMADMMNTRQYLIMRREAFKNDGIAPNVNNAPDLLVWDTTRYTDLKKLLIGGIAHTTDAQASISGGNDQTQFLINGGYHHQTTIFPGDMADNRISVHLNLNHNSKDQKFSFHFITGYAVDENNLIASNLSSYLTLPPNIPPLFDSIGNLNWQQGGEPFINPLSYLLDKYKAVTDNLLSNMQMSYRFLPRLKFKINLGYNAIRVNETSIIPAAAQNPEYSTSGTSQFGNNDFKSWIIEPQLTYTAGIKKGILSLLIGSTWQETRNSNSTIDASGYSSDALLESIDAASSITIHNNFNQYRYEALFGRLNYNWRNKYIINFSGRRDGSSRFGPGKRFSNFGAVGIAWIFSEEPFLKKIFPFISYGKVRTSYGTTGNDQIGDYGFLDTWSTTQQSYKDVTGLYPTRLFNPDYGWEINRKFEGALELGLLHDIILFSGSFFRNRSSNQLISYSLPVQTGFTGITKNLPALVQNTGLEFMLTLKLFSTREFHWNSKMNLTIPKNKLISFPGLETSSYSHRYILGQSLSVLNYLQLTGVDPQTGIYQFKDLNKDGSFDFKDYQESGNLDPKFYGGWSNNFSYKNWELEVFIEFRNQLGLNYLSAIYSNIPGTMTNGPTLLLDRWRQPGDLTGIEQFSQKAGAEAYQAWSLFPQSNGIYGNASYLRLKTLSLSYQFPASWLNKIHIKNCQLFIRGQNLGILTRYKGPDPETQDLYGLSPLKTVTAGIHLRF